MSEAAPSSFSDEPVDLRSFEATFGQLEEIVRRLEGGTLTLDESLAHYERGVAALKRCYRILEAAEKKLELLIRCEDGSVETRPLDLVQLRGEGGGAAQAAAASAPAGPVKRKEGGAERSLFRP